MMTPPRPLTALLLLACALLGPAAALRVVDTAGRRKLFVGKRSILCTTPLGGKKEDALMNPKPTLPFLLGYVGCQAFLPTVGKCPGEVMFQMPWYTGPQTAGFCPPEYWNLGASLPGLILLGAAAAMNVYANQNRLVITSTALGTMKADGNIKDAEMVDFKGITESKMTPLGLIVKRGTDTTFFPAFWDPKSVEALLEDVNGSSFNWD